MRFGKQRGQSLLEYIISLTVILTAVVAGTIGLRRGVDTELETGLAEGLADAQATLADDHMRRSEDGEIKDMDALYGEVEEFEDPERTGEYYFQEGENTHVGGIPVAELEAMEGQGYHPGTTPGEDPVTYVDENGDSFEWDPVEYSGGTSE
ncbi:MAG: hypothetical protein GF333_07970 [Candidatus Omnitrophica bacterium]|nr:hypothetical protein [Candidatus Omnitrophota bacterium]